MSGQIAETQPKAEEVFQNVRVLKGLTYSQFMDTMGFFSASLGANCTYCHVLEAAGDWSKYADDHIKEKNVARGMVAMVNSMNKQFFGGRRMLTCYSCHRGGDHPSKIPSLARIYAPVSDEPADDFFEAEPRQSADPIFDKFIAATGGARTLAALTSWVAKGTYKGYDGQEKSKVEIYAKAPNMRLAVVHTGNGDTTQVYDGKNGWIAAPTTDRPLGLVTLIANDIENVRVDADFAFPLHIKESYPQWRVGFPTIIEDRDVYYVQGESAGRTRVRLFFDKQTGLLRRYIRYTENTIGLNPTQVDFSDYRDINGVKMPFKFTITWQDGRSDYELSEITANVPIEASRFTRPSAPPPNKTSR